jgi:catechol 2,3-dioxygenase-like lactoylglutathione lyase family enzyme
MKSNWEHGHTGVFARDFDKTLHYYRSLGLAPDLGPRQRPPRSPADKFVNIEFGQVVDNYIDPKTPFLELLYIGDLEFEVLHAPAKRPAGEALSYGEGVNHLCFCVPDIDGETEILVDKGFRIIQDAKLNDVRIEDYLDTREFGNILLSLRPLQTEGAKAKKAGYGIVNWKYRGVGAVVKDLARTVKYYQSMGIATFGAPSRFDTTTVEDVMVYGRSTKDAIRAKTRLMTIASVTYELIEPSEGAAIYRESLDRRGEGVINLTFDVADLEQETARLAAKGVPVVFSGKPQKGAAFAYLDTRKDGGDVMIKLLQR